MFYYFILIFKKTIFIEPGFFSFILRCGDLFVLYHYSIITVPLFYRTGTSAICIQRFSSGGMGVDLFNKQFSAPSSHLSSSVVVLNSYKKSYFIPFWVRITLFGKGYRVRKFKKTNLFIFYLGHSHWTRLLLTNSTWFHMKIRRRFFVVGCFSYRVFKFFKRTFLKVKFPNHYTKRGLRFKRMFLRRRFGKISQMISSMHF